MTCTLELSNGETLHVDADPLGTESLSDIGFCIACGAERNQTEQDAECYPCDACGDNTVFGAMQLVFMDRLTPEE
jgi:hypothetical protein